MGKSAGRIRRPLYEETLLALGDIHFPFEHGPSLKTALDAISRLQPTTVVQMGDLYDLFSFSRYARSLNYLTPKDEVTLARGRAVATWSAIAEAAPKATLRQLRGNHDIRVESLLKDKVPSLAGLLGVDDWYKFAGVVTHMDATTEVPLRVNGRLISLHHGFLSNPGSHMRHFETSTITGHSHRGHVLYETTRNGQRFDANAGYLADPKSPVFRYGESSKKNWTRGYLTVDASGPRFVCLEK